MITLWSSSQEQEREEETPWRKDPSSTGGPALARVQFQLVIDFLPNP